MRSAPKFICIVDDVILEVWVPWDAKWPCPNNRVTE
jgi:hypothetical protein